MSYLEKLLEGVKLEWKSLGNDTFFEIANSGRKPVKASERSPGKVPYYGANNIQDYVEGYTHNGEYVLIAEDGTQSLENYSIQWATGKFWANNHVHVIRGTDLLNNRFVFHYLKTVNFIPFLSGGGRAKLTKGKLVEIQIPIPPLSIQKEIVRILDTFTELTAELTAELTTELTTRKKQYQYYCDELLTFDEGEACLSGRQVEWKTLAEIAIIGTGSRNTNESVEGGKYPFFVRSQRPRAINEYEFDETAIITAGDGVGVGKVFHYVTGKYALHQRAYRIVANDNCVISEYLFHFIRNNFAKYLEMTSVHASVTSLRKPMFEKYLVAIPTLKEQERIVSILDKFDTITNSISEGLSKEIELRQKQHEYYRDMLLTFPKQEHQ